MMKQRILIMILAFLGVSAVGQEFSERDQAKLERYNEIIADPNSHDTALARAYVNLGEIMAQADYASIRPLTEKAIEVAEAALLKDQPEEVVKSLTQSLGLATNNMGFLLNTEGQIEPALEYLEQSLRMRRTIGDAYGIAECLGNIGSVWSSRGDYSKALEYFNESYELAKTVTVDTRRAKSMGNAEGNIAMMYQMAGENQQAFEMARRGVVSNTKAGFEFGVGINYGTIGSLHEDEGQLDSALFYLNKQKGIFKKFENEMGLGMAVYAIGRVHFKLGEYETAIENYTYNLNIAEGISNQVGISQAKRNLGEVFTAMARSKGTSSGDRSKYLTLAEENLESSLEIADEIGHLNRMKLAAQDLTEVYKAQGRTVDAFEMYQKFIQIKDSLDNDEKQTAFAQEQFKFEYEKQKAIDEANHEKELAIAAEQEEKQRILTYSVAGGLGLSAVFLFFVFNRLRITRKQNLLLAQQNEIIEQSHKEITDSIHYAKRIQAAVLPPNSVFKALLPNAFVLYKPKDIVAGDFYWLEEKNGTVLFAAADCTGHGVPGAMVSVICNNGLNRSVREMGLTDPGKILDNTRNIVVSEFEKSEEEVKDGMDIALCSLDGNTLKYAGANNPLWLYRNGELHEYKANKQPIGKFDEPLPYTTHSIEVQSGDSVYIFSDGFVDQFGGENGKKYKSVKFKAFLKELSNSPLVDQKTLLDREFETWKSDQEQIDDVCVIGLKI
ncbi:MAG: tetratricopeptide repeat protein [Flavobacteriales bacterium]|nr:tetratricopeptide repeat protein [Flavobacteriales bacterium]